MDQPASAFKSSQAGSIRDEFRRLYRAGHPSNHRHLGGSPAGRTCGGTARERWNCRAAGFDAPRSAGRTAMRRAGSDARQRSPGPSLRGPVSNGQPRPEQGDACTSRATDAREQHLDDAGLHGPAPPYDAASQRTMNARVNTAVPKALLCPCSTARASTRDPTLPRPAGRSECRMPSRTTASKHPIRRVREPDASARTQDQERTSSVTTSKFAKVDRPKLVDSATSVASRPRAMRMRPMRGTLWRASNVYQRPSR